MRYGLLCNTDPMGPSVLRDFAAEFDDSPFESLWVPELFGREPFVTAAYLLQHTRRARIHTGIANVYARDAMATRAAATTLAELSGNRFALGLGVSNKVGNAARGHEWQPPVALLERYLDHYRDAPLTGAPDTSVSLYLAAHGPKLLDIAARRTDGALSYLSTPAYHREAKARLGSKELIVMQPTALAADEAEGRRLARRALSIYLPLENYHRAWRAQGFDPADYSDGGSDRFVDTLVAWGDAAAVAERFDAHRQNGVDRIVIIPLNYDERRAPELTRLAEVIAAG